MRPLPQIPKSLQWDAMPFPPANELIEGHGHHDHHGRTHDSTCAICCILHNQRALSVQLGELSSQIGSLMSALSDYAAKVTAIFNDVSTQVDAIMAKLTAIQNSPGTISPDDQAALDAALALGTNLQTKVDTDALPTPPAVTSSSAPVVNPGS